MVRTLITAVLGAASLASIAQNDVKDQVVLSIGSGNAQELARHFVPNVDLTVLENSDVYSKAQAEQILRRFFEEHEPVGMVIEHSGDSKVGDKYYIGILRTRTIHYRVTFFLKRTNDLYQVKQLRIEAPKGDL